MRRLFALILGMTSLLVLAAPTSFASHDPCAGDAFAWDKTWSDHYWLGTDGIDGYPVCDQVSTFLVAVQRINKGIRGSYTQSAIDGYYGPKTQADIMAVQGFWGIRRDGLVGPTTWGRYDDYVYLRYQYADGTRTYYLSVYQPGTDMFRQLYNGSVAWEARPLGLAGWEEFSVYKVPSR